MEMATVKANVNTWLGQAHKYCKVYLVYGTPCPTTHTIIPFLSTDIKWKTEINNQLKTILHRLTLIQKTVHFHRN